MDRWVGRCVFFGQFMSLDHPDQMSRGSLCSVVKTLIVSGAQRTDQGTRTPTELFWTAKNGPLYHPPPLFSASPEPRSPETHLV